MKPTGDKVLDEALRLQDTLELLEAATDNTDVVRLRARERVLADRVADLMEASLNSRGVGRGYDPSLHPRDRLGRWMERLDSKVHQSVLAASRRRAKRELVDALTRTGAGRIPHRTLDTGKPGRPDVDRSGSFREYVARQPDFTSRVEGAGVVTSDGTSQVTDANGRTLTGKAYHDPQDAYDELTSLRQQAGLNRPGGPDPDPVDRKALIAEREKLQQDMHRVFDHQGPQGVGEMRRLKRRIDRITARLSQPGGPDPSPAR